MGWGVKNDYVICCVVRVHYVSFGLVFLVYDERRIDNDEYWKEVDDECERDRLAREREKEQKEIKEGKKKDLDGDAAVPKV